MNIRQIKHKCGATIDIDCIICPVCQKKSDQKDYDPNEEASKLKRENIDNKIKKLTYIGGYIC